MIQRGQFKEFSYDPELADDEISQIDLAISGVNIAGGKQLDKGSGLNLQSSFLLRKRLSILTVQVDSLNQSSRRLEKATWLLLGTSVLLLPASLLPR